MRALKGALVASALFAAFGFVCLVPYLLRPDLFTPATVGWVAVAVAVPTTALLAWRYLVWVGGGQREGWVLGLALVALHLPFDLIVVPRLAPPLAPVFLWPGPLFYLAMLFVPPLTAGLRRT